MWEECAVVDRTCKQCKHRIADDYWENRDSLHCRDIEQYATCSAVKNYHCTTMLDFKSLCGNERKLFSPKPREVPKVYDFINDPPPLMQWAI